MIYKLKEKQKSGFELTKENANLLLDTINFVIRF